MKLLLYCTICRWPNLFVNITLVCYNKDSYYFYCSIGQLSYFEKEAYHEVY